MTLAENEPKRRPRGRPQPRPRVALEQAEPVVDVGSLAEQNDQLRAQLSALADQVATLATRGVPYVASEPANPIPPQRIADDAELTPWLRELRQRTRPVPPDYQPDNKPYNHKSRWFMKPDGSVVELQGSPQALSYYQDKGYVLLTSDQERHYLTVEKSKIVKQQQERANLINGIRRAVQLDPVLQTGLDPSWETDLDKMTAAELQGQFDEIAGTPTADGRPRKMFKRLQRLQDADDRRAEQDAERLLEGVETTPPRALRQQFDASLQRGRTIEVTPATVGTFA